MGTNLKLALAGIGTGLIFFAGFLVGSLQKSASTDRQNARETTAPRKSLSAIESPNGSSTHSSKGLIKGDWLNAANATTEEKAFTIMRLNDPMERQAMMMDFIMNANAAELREIGAAAKAWYNTGGVVGREVEGLGYRQGQVLGREMFDQMTKDPNGKLHVGRLRNMNGWASTSPDEARAWLEELPEGTVKSQLRDAWFKGLVADSPEKAAELFSSLPIENRSRSIGALYSSLHRFGGMDSVVDWFMETADGEGIEGVNPQQAFGGLTHRLGALGQGDPAAVEEVLLKPEIAPYLNAGNFASATRNAAALDPGRVIDLIADLPGSGEDGKVRDMRGMVSKTVHQSTLGTINNLGNWLSENADHPLYDMTTRFFVERAAREDPEAASQWAKTITDPDLAEEVSRFIIE